MSRAAARAADAAPAAPAAPGAGPAPVPASRPRAAGAACPVEEQLSRLLSPRRAPPGISGPWRALGEFATRPGKRIRPRLVELGYRAAGGKAPAAEVARFAAGLEAMHAFFLVHDDVADRADTRRGGPALHRVLGEGRLGEQLAVVAGDLLFVEALEAMLGCGLPGAAAATREVLATCRDTAAGQYLDIANAERPISAVSPAEARRAAALKTARYSFEAPLIAGALLAHDPCAAGARPPSALLDGLRAVARPLGLAFQLQDDLIPFRAGEAAGKPALADLVTGKKTWLLTLAWRRLDEVGRARLRRCLQHPDAAAFARVQRMVASSGALARVEREVRRLCRQARAAAARPELAAAAAPLSEVIDRVGACR